MITNYLQAEEIKKKSIYLNLQDKLMSE